MLGEVPAVAVLYTISPVAGLAMALEVVAVELKATRGGRKPWLVASTCSLAEALGLDVPIPTCENPITGQKSETNRSALIHFEFCVLRSIRF